MKLNESIQEYLRYMEMERGCSIHTIKSYTHALGKFQEFMGEKSKITAKRFPMKVRAYRDSVVKESGIGWKTKNLRLIPVASLFTYLRLRYGLNDLPRIEFMNGKVKHTLKKLPTREELKEFLEPTGNDECDMAVQLIYATGLRISELMSLQVGQVKESFPIIGKGDKQRLIVCRKDVVDFVREREGDVGPLFKKSMSHIQHCISARGKKFGLKLSAHTLRHCFASDILDRGMNIRQVQVLLGHNSITTTQIYTHVSDKDLVDSYNSVY